MDSAWYRKRVVASIFGVIVLFGSGLSFAQVTSAGACSRIISLAPSITEMLYALDLGDRLVANTTYCKYPPEAAKLPHLGGLFDTNIEAALLLSPSMIVGLAESKTVISDFDKLRIRTLTVSDRSIYEIQQSLSSICERCDCQSRAQVLIDNLKEQTARLALVREKQSRIDVALIVASSLSSGSDELYLSGNDGYYSSIFKLLNTRNVFAGNTAVMPSASLETLVSLSPQMVFVVESSAENFEKLRVRIGNYLPKTKVVQLSADYAVIPGPRFPLLMQDIANGLDLSN